MSFQRVHLVDPCRFTREALSAFLARQGLIADVDLEDGAAVEWYACVVVGDDEPDGTSSTCDLHPHATHSVSVHRGDASLPGLLDLLMAGGAKTGVPIRGVAALRRPNLGHSALTRREQAVLREIARGGSSRQIAATLGIQARTVEHHKASIYAKLDVRNQAQAVVTAERSGLLTDGSHAT